MDAERESQAADIFADALDVPIHQRSRFLYERCGSDAALRARVESLLAAHPDGAAFFRDAACLKEALASVAAPADRDLGQRVGAYKLTRLLAEGGMGRVYLAHRSDADFEQAVAVKLLHAGLDSASILRRFFLERQLLARLACPGIARLVDGGSTTDGRPYLVMEYIEGTHIDLYCDEQELGVRERLQLFLTVCDAVQYAHRNLVVHRDLKPSNILVNASGQPKLLDFGIAKVLASGDGEANVATATALGLMTPRYASPEQLRGDDVSTATDIYSLGVILYEILTGLSPYRTTSGAFIDVFRCVCEHEPPAPSAIVGRSAEPRGGNGAGDLQGAAPSAPRGAMPRKLSRLLAGDLDTIVLKALRKEPERRYASVDEMADDIRRHLAGHTVSARPDTLRYRVSRFARRNRILVGSVAAVFTALTVGLAASYLQYQNAERARVRETLQRAEAERLAYRSGLLAAESSIRTNHLLEARRQLEAAPAHLRGWEWRHLAARLDHSLLSIPAHDGAVTAVAWGHDGQIFTSGEDRMVRMWDAQSGAARGDLGPFESAPRSLDVGASGAHIAVGFEEGHVAVIALGGGETVELRDPNPMAYVRPTPPPQEDSQIATLNLPATWPHVDFHPQGAELATGFYSGFVQIWNPQTRDTISARPQEHGGDKTLVGWSPSGAELIVGSGFDPPCLVDAATLKVVRKFPGSGGQVDFRFTRDGKRLAVAYHDGHRITVWDAESGAESVTLHTPGGSLRAVDFDAKGDHLVSASTGGGLAVWDLSTGRVVAQLLGHTADVQCLATSTDGSRIATGDWDGMLKVWSWDTQDVQVLHLPSGGFRRIWADALSLAPDGERFVTNLTGVSLLLWDLRAHRLISRLAIHDPTTRRRALRLAWSRDGRRALAGLEDGTLEFVDVAAGRVEREVAVGAQGVQALDIHPSLPRCVVGFGDSIEIRSIETGECIDRLIGHAAEVLVARFGPDGRWLATAGVDRTVRLWDVRTGTCGHVLTGHTDRVCDVAFSPDVAWLVSASWDGTVRLWDTRTGRCAKTLYRGDRRMYGVAFTHDGTRVAAAGFDGVVRLFDPAAGFEVAQLHGHEGRVFALAFTPDDTALISTSLDGTVRIWEAPPAEPP